MRAAAVSALAALGAMLISTSRRIQRTPLTCIDLDHAVTWDADADLADRLRAALANGTVTAAYQPLIDLRDGVVVGIEALARWDDPELGVVTPTRFVAVAEQSDLILDLTDRMLALAGGCRDRLRAAGHEVDHAVNVSARYLDERLVDLVAAHIGDDVDGLVLEITETGLMVDTALAARTLDQLVRAGARVAIDDFGVGRSSLSYLLDLPVSTLKLDRSFVSRIGDGSAAEAVIRSTLDLADRLGVEVVAEGVERQDQLEALRRLGCDRVQGFLLAPPLTEADLLVLLDHRGSRNVRTTTLVGVDGSCEGLRR